MSAGRGISQLLRKAFHQHPFGSSLPSSFRLNHEEASGFTASRALAILGVGASGLLSFATIASADEAEHGLEAPNYPWPHAGILSSYDHASLPAMLQTRITRAGWDFNGFIGSSTCMPFRFFILYTWIRLLSWDACPFDSSSYILEVHCCCM